MREFQSVLLIGGTSEIGLGVIRSLARRGTRDIALLARDSNELQISTAKLASESPESMVHSYVLEADISSQVDKLIQVLKPELVVISIGQMANQSAIENNPNLIHSLNAGNVDIPVMALLATVNSFERLGKGSIAVFGSVAGDRGRSINYVYGAGKAFLETICQGLWQRIQGTEIQLTLVKPGPTETKMSRQIHRSRVKLASVDQVSEVIVEGILSGRSVVYAPRFWRYIMKIVVLLPNYVFNRLHF